jgi:hypothetical protein
MKAFILATTALFSSHAMAESDALFKALNGGDVKSAKILIVTGDDIKQSLCTIVDVTGVTCVIAKAEPQNAANQGKNKALNLAKNAQPVACEPRPILTSVDKIDLIKMVVQRGENPNQLCNEGQSAVIDRVGDAKVMNALLDLGADPKLRQGAGNQPLISFLFSYQNANDKAEFRAVVKRMLDMGASPHDCFSDHSSCISDVVKSHGDADLAQLIEQYR